MDFWSAISDVSAVITVGGAVWQAGKRVLFKKVSCAPGTPFLKNSAIAPF